MTPENYLRSVLTEKDAKAVELAISAGLPVLIQGVSGPTGKSTLADYLQAKGVNVAEQYEMDAGMKRMGDKDSNCACILITLNETIKSFNSRPLYHKSHMPETVSQH